jgi:hypothetical protein
MRFRFFIIFASSGLRPGRRPAAFKSSLAFASRSMGEVALSSASAGAP